MTTEASPGSGGSGLGWKQKLLARSYFHSPLPSVVRRIRNRYELSASNEAGGGRRTFRKRNEPSGRILYFHRVNDDNDPFFPAISTSLFEREMAFLRKHHTVVSLSELLERLAGPVSEPLVAITFDDGYRDNYLNAFPILDQYGLPATIFLTTGSMDSDEPLWFERLALGFKKTAQEFVNLEIGCGRLWLRNEQERLNANDKVFGILRGLADGERRARLEAILQQLRVCEDELRGRMLTWNHVRRMQQRRIDFGGHTVTHPFLSRLSSDRFHWEISECKRRIEQEAQRPVEYLAYPNGREEDFGAMNKALVRDAGYRAAVTTIWGLNYGATDRMELRRGGPWEPSVAEFAYKLDWYQLANG